MIRKWCAACAATVSLKAARGTKYVFEIDRLVARPQPVASESLLSEVGLLPDDLEGHCLIMGFQGQLCADTQLGLAEDGQAVLRKVNRSTVQDLVLGIEQGSRQQLREYATRRSPLFIQCRIPHIAFPHVKAVS